MSPTQRSLRQCYSDYTGNIMNASISLRALSCSMIAGMLLISGNAFADRPHGPRAKHVVSKQITQPQDEPRTQYIAQNADNASGVYARTDQKPRDARRVGPRNTIRR